MKREYKSGDSISKMGQLIPFHPSPRVEKSSSGTHKGEGRSLHRIAWTRLLLAGLVTFLALLALLHWIATTHTAYPTLSTATCADAIRNTDYTKTTPQLTPDQQIEAVQLINDVIGGQPSALVQVAHTDNLLDIYVYGCIIRQQSPTLTLLLKQQGLIQGTVEVTEAHTLSIGQLDSSLGIDSGSLLLPLQENIYHEYKWSNGQLRQIKFPALYPVTTRSEAKALQNIATNGQTLPWNDPLATAEQMAQDIFHQSTDLMKATLLHKDQANANVLLVLKKPQAKVMVTLKRLIEQDNKGIWFVTSAQSPDISLDQSNLNSPISSPLIIHGTFKRHVGKVNITIFDHTLTPLQLPSNPTQPPTPTMASVTVNTHNTYTATISHTHNRAIQPGLLLIEALPAKNSNDPEQILLTNLLLE
jgi:hypothetical protein